MKRKYAIASLAAVIVLALLFYFYGGSQAPPGQPPLQNLNARNIAHLRNQFNAAKDDVRVLLLLSPT